MVEQENRSRGKCHRDNVEYLPLPLILSALATIRLRGHMGFQMIQTRAVMSEGTKECRW